MNHTSGHLTLGLPTPCLKAPQDPHADPNTQNKRPQDSDVDPKTQDPKSQAQSQNHTIEVPNSSMLLPRPQNNPTSSLWELVLELGVQGGRQRDWSWQADSNPDEIRAWVGMARLATASTYLNHGSSGHGQMLLEQLLPAGGFPREGKALGRHG